MPLGIGPGGEMTFSVGTYVGNPDSSNETPFETQYNSFVQVMRGAHPTSMDAFTDLGQDPSQWAANNAWTAGSWTATGNSYVGPGSGTTPVIGVPLASNAGGWGNIDTFYQGIISGQYDAD